jgi:hypothetical protein
MRLFAILTGCAERDASAFATLVVAATLLKGHDGCVKGRNRYLKRVGVCTARPSRFCAKLVMQTYLGEDARRRDCCFAVTMSGQSLGVNST